MKFSAGLIAPLLALLLLFGGFFYLYAAPDGRLHDVLRDYGEFLAILAGGALILYQMQHEQWKEAREKASEEMRRKRTARYWVFYNASNRVSQDLSVIREVYSSQRDFADKDATAERLNHYAKILKGFQNTWENDDVLNSALSFEFSLLTRPEKRAILDYFASYNEVEDRISLQLPFLVPGEHVQSDGAKLPGYTTLSGVVTSEQELLELLERLYADLGRLIVQGIELMELLQSIDEFPGFRTRMKTYKAACRNLDVNEQPEAPQRLLPHELPLRTREDMMKGYTQNDILELDREREAVEKYARRELGLRKSAAKAG